MAVQHTFITILVTLAYVIPGQCQSLWSYYPPANYPAADVSADRGLRPDYRDFKLGGNLPVETFDFEEPIAAPSSTVRWFGFMFPTLLDLSPSTINHTLGFATFIFAMMRVTGTAFACMIPCAPSLIWGLEMAVNWGAAALLYMPVQRPASYCCRTLFQINQCVTLAGAMSMSNYMISRTICSETKSIISMVFSIAFLVAGLFKTFWLSKLLFNGNF